jgi:hypothetical protein
MAKIEGACLCGQVRYSSETEPLMTVLCHCKNCQRHSGTAFSTNIAIPRGSLNVDGRLSFYTDTGDTGNIVNRFFCPNCGSAIYSESEVLDTLTILKAGTLDDTLWVLPTMEVYCDSAQQWTRLKTEMEAHAKMLPV